ncbi:MAG: GFA family protein [Burkholderiaceae bacterium]|nr:GFA family protein [Burkholderiaceae bacterium]
MSEHQGNINGRCNCGHARFSIKARPLFRAYCHCLICQDFNQADFADVTVFLKKDVSVEDESTIRFRVHKQPPLLKRGTCAKCAKPAVERLSIPLMPRMTIVPSANIHDPSLMVKPALHIFYHRRKADVHDELPKYSGFLSSQMHFGIVASKAMLHRS